MSRKLKIIVSKFIVTSMAMSVFLFSGTPTVNVFAATTKTVTNFSDLKTAVTNASNGDVIQIAANTLDCTSQLIVDKSGITIEPASGYSPVLDFTSFRTAAKAESPTATGDKYVGVRVSGGSNTIQGLTIEKAYDNGMLIKPSSSSSTPNSNNIIDCVFSYNGDAGFQITGSQDYKVYPSNNKVVGCVAYRNFDPLTSGGNADGFSPKLYIGNGNTFSYCVSAENSDDAWDSFGSLASNVTYDHCVAYHNGDPAIFTGAYDKANGLGTDSDLTIGTSTGNGNGFKLGSGSSKYGAASSGLRTMTDCLAVNNTSKGFDANNSVCTINLTNGMSFGNGKADYYLTGTTVANTFTNAQAFSAASANSAPSGGTITTVTSSKQSAIKSEVDTAIKTMRTQLANKKIPSRMSFSFWN
ncbi:right-handed parallel beta-helix repeat-containing protein [uncultured Clostridium sp.]|uniref:right-handed parallel beta-helix repeat-containing protein n=1 Tax=uncultured Clostridium sp. TaxID=59620 RepID=UPI0028EDCB6C|nr:right-handed parallel beta-helix repeat-containing protein [uncultured Clostridium sp.]